MKKINRLFLILFVIDLVVLLGYGQAQEETRATYTYYRVGFYWYYFFPAAYFFGGYLLGQSLLSRSRISLHPIVEKILFTLILRFEVKICANFPANQVRVKCRLRKGGQRFFKISVPKLRLPPAGNQSLCIFSEYRKSCRDFMFADGCSAG